MTASIAVVTLAVWLTALLACFVFSGFLLRRRAYVVICTALVLAPELSTTHGPSFMYGGYFPMIVMLPFDIYATIANGELKMASYFGPPIAAAIATVAWLFCRKYVRTSDRGNRKDQGSSVAD